MSEKKSEKNLETATQDNKKVRIHLNQKDMTTNYANSFRPILSAEEVMLDFGVNHSVPANANDNNGASADIIFDVTNRIIMNYNTVKRLTLALTKIVTQYEQQYGELKIGRTSRTPEQS